MRRCLLAMVGTAVLVAGGCTYDSVRADIRRDCQRMPDSERERCLRRTADTPEEYEAKRRELERSVEGRAADPEKRPADRRRQEWIP